MKPSLREQINVMEERLNKAFDHENWQTKEVNGLHNQNIELLKKIDELNRDKNWLKQLCQEQSSSIAEYMRSR